MGKKASNPPPPQPSDNRRGIGEGANVNPPSPIYRPKPPPPPPPPSKKEQLAVKEAKQLKHAAQSASSCGHTSRYENSIDNSQGIHIHKTLLERTGLSDEVVLEEERGQG